ncbi:ABC1 kinase family protein [Streptomyces spectabilis]|uniref:Ubiquinone biosynthesis protein n=1 Tax=Streptomyces spectabilis TaxID=68270 RepID=A0A7W8AMC6_STRST|nr:AarF/UbiB family protein [Streptomyces spectabilis]MBB5101013.1 ubiquinone biosynthesis protein [Streptomyces spectabilis]MCI3900225.1 AarF/UbiB family protein [Streptomyces spectabilis]
MSVATAAARVAGAALVHPRRAGDAAADSLVRAVESLGGAYIKAGQLLATRSDLIGPRLAHRLSRLQDDVAAMSGTDALAVLERSHLPWPASAYSAVAKGPVASGSIACVYRWEPDSGAPLALKIRRPDAAETVPIDTAMLRSFARLCAMTPWMRSSPVVAIVDDLCSAVLNQLDLDRERIMLTQFRGVLKNEDHIVVPAPVDEYSNSELLAMEFVDGLDRKTFATAAPSLRDEGIITLVRAMYDLVFVHGFVHIDLHQGNAYLLPDGRLVLLDVGFAHVLSDFSRERFTRFFGGMVTGRGQECAEILLSTTKGIDHHDQNLVRFKAEVVRLVEESAELDVAHFSVPRFAARLFQIQQSNGYYAEPEMMFPLLCLIALEGTVNELAPHMDFQIEAAPYIMSSLIDL